MNSEITTERAPMVSVVMIAWNKERYIDEAIRGVVGQRAPWRIELIVMDDASTDRTGELAREWARRYPERVKVVRNPENLGLQRNYMAGFTHCRGRYLAICDADDYWTSAHKLRRQVEYMEAHPECGLTFHRVVNYYEDSGEMSLSGSVDSNPTLAMLCRGNFITNLSVVYRRELVDLTHLPEWFSQENAPDYALHMLYAVKGTMHCFNRPMGVYRKVSGSAWATAGAFSRLEKSLTVRLRLLPMLQSGSAEERELRGAARRILAAMLPVANCEAESTAIEAYVRELGCELPKAAAPANRAAHRTLLSRLRGFVSRLLPRPRPPRV